MGVGGGNGGGGVVMEVIAFPFPCFDVRRALMMMLIFFLCGGSAQTARSTVLDA